MSVSLWKTICNVIMIDQSTISQILAHDIFMIIRQQIIPGVKVEMGDNWNMSTFIMRQTGGRHFFVQENEIIGVAMKELMRGQASVSEGF